MARILVLTVPVVGHVAPAEPIVRELVARGHRVLWYTGQAFRQRVEASGAEFASMRKALDYSQPENIPAVWAQQRSALKGLAQLRFDVEEFFIAAAVGQVEDCEELLRNWKADVVLADSCFYGAAWLHERGGPPWAEFGASVLMHRSKHTAPFGPGLKPGPPVLGPMRDAFLRTGADAQFYRHVDGRANALRTEMGLPPEAKGIFDVRSPYLHLAGTVPSFEYPRKDLPKQVHFVGPLLPSPSSDFSPPDWWGELDGSRPVVLVTQGTVATDPVELIRPALEALEGEKVLVVVTTGGRPPEELGRLPDNARAASFVPYGALMPKVGAMVTNGGYGGVQFALSNGVPLVTAGASEDKPEVCARVEWAGVGIYLKTKSPPVDKLKAAVSRVLSQPGYRANARRIQQEMSGYNGPAGAAELIERLERTGQPVQGAV